MAIERIPGGGHVITGEHIELYRMLALRGALRLELKGLRHSRGSAYATIKKVYGIRGNKTNVLTQFEELIEKKFPKAVAS